jgi:hypothetical protein
MRLHTSQQKAEDSNLSKQDFLAHKEVTATQDVTKTPKHGRTKVDDKKYVLLVPWSVVKEDEKQRNIGYRGNQRNQGIYIHLNHRIFILPNYVLSFECCQEGLKWQGNMRNKGRLPLNLTQG